MKYNKWTLEELQKAARDRHITVRAGQEENRAEHVRALNHADHTVQMPQLLTRLTPELRLVVYDLLLTRGRKGTGKRHLAILLASREIYREASPVFRGAPVEIYLDPTVMVLDSTVSNSSRKSWFENPASDRHLAYPGQ